MSNEPRREEDTIPAAVFEVAGGGIGIVEKPKKPKKRGGKATREKVQGSVFETMMQLSEQFGTTPSCREGKGAAPRAFSRYRMAPPARGQVI